VTSDIGRLRKTFTYLLKPSGPDIWTANVHYNFMSETKILEKPVFFRLAYNDR